MTAWRGGLPAVLADLARRQTRWTYRALAGHLAVPGPRTIRQVAEALDETLRADHAAGRLAAAVIVSAHPAACRRRDFPHLPGTRPLFRP